jgi:hypothetical protein
MRAASAISPLMPLRHAAILRDTPPCLLPPFAIIFVYAIFDDFRHDVSLILMPAAAFRQLTLIRHYILFSPQS